MDLDKFERFISNSFCNVGQSFYDKYVEANVNFRSKLGMKEVIIRRQLGHCCEWCASLAGIYNAWNMPADIHDNIYRRHRNCRCLVTYKSEDGYQDVWNKKIYQTQRDARIDRIKELSTQQPIKRNYLRITEVRASIITEMVKRGEISLKLSQQSYNNHCSGTMEYYRKMQSRANKGLNPQSILTISFGEAQKIINKYSGTGIIKRNKNGEIIKTERITCDKIIGKCCSNGVWYETNKAQIHHSNNGSHLVPILGSKYD